MACSAVRVVDDGDELAHHLVLEPPRHEGAPLFERLGREPHVGEEVHDVGDRLRREHDGVDAGLEVGRVRRADRELGGLRRPARRHRTRSASRPRKLAQPLPVPPAESTVACTLVTEPPTSVPWLLATATVFSAVRTLPAALSPRSADALTICATAAARFSASNARVAALARSDLEHRLRVGQPDELLVRGRHAGGRHRRVAAGSERRVVAAVRARDADLLADDRAHAHERVLLGDVLVDAVVREAGERAGLGDDERFGLVGVRELDGAARELACLIRCEHQRPTPT